MSDGSAATYSRAVESPRAVLLACMVISVGTNAYMIAPASVIPLLVEEFGVRKAGAGTAISIAILGSVLAQLPSGVLMDRYDNRRVMRWAVAGFVLASVGALVVESYPVLLATRFVGGAVVGLSYTMSANIVGRAFPAHRRGFATSVFVASAPVGFALSQLVGPLLAATVGWSAVFAAYAAIVVAGYAAFRTLTPAAIRTGGRPSLRGIVTAFRDRAILLVSLSSFCASACYLFLNSWMPTYGNEVLAVPLAGAGALAAIVPLTGILARPSGGWLSDAIGGRRRPVIAASLVLVPPLLVAVPRAGSALTYALVLLLAGFVVQLGYGVYFAFTQELAPADAEGVSLTVFTTVSYAGSLVSPFAGGWLIQTFSWEAAFAVYTALAVVGVAAVVAVREPRAAPG